MNVNPVIAVFGSSNSKLPENVAEMSERLGEAIAAKEWSLATGGYSGVMEAASRGAHKHDPNAHVIGVTTDIFQHRSGPNRYVNDERIQQGLLNRIGCLMQDADAYVLIWGGIGTLAELFLAWNLIATGWDKPLVAIGPWWNPLLDAMQAEMEISNKARAVITVVDTVEEAMEALEKRLKPSL